MAYGLYPDALREINKTQSLVEMTQAARIIRKADIDLHGMFIYGMDSATLNSGLRNSATLDSYNVP